MPLPKEELNLFKQLKDLKVIFDVGARVDTDYLKLWPDSEHHLFEPHPDFFKELKEKVGDRSNVFLNNYGLGDKEEDRGYQLGLQSFIGSEAVSEGNTVDLVIPIKRLDDYMNVHKIEQIDFLKIDTEGFDYKVLLSTPIKKCRYIQYEHWNDKLQFHNLLEDDFIMCYVGLRNVLCIRKGEEWP